MARSAARAARLRLRAATDADRSSAHRVPASLSLEPLGFEGVALHDHFQNLGEWRVAPGGALELRKQAAVLLQRFEAHHCETEVVACHARVVEATFVDGLRELDRVVHAARIAL